MRQLLHVLTLLCLSDRVSFCATSFAPLSLVSKKKQDSTYQGKDTTVKHYFGYTTFTWVALIFSALCDQEDWTIRSSGIMHCKMVNKPSTLGSSRFRLKAADGFFTNGDFLLSGLQGNEIKVLPPQINVYHIFTAIFSLLFRSCKTQSIKIVIWPTFIT